MCLNTFSSGVSTEEEMNELFLKKLCYHNTMLE